MSVTQWFLVGIGGAAALCWLWFIVRWMTFDKAEKFDPFHLRSDFEPEDRPYIGAGLFFGVIVWALTPVWMPFYLFWALKPDVRRRLQPVRRTYLAFLGGDRSAS